MFLKFVSLAWPLFWSSNTSNCQVSCSQGCRPGASETSITDHDSSSSGSRYPDSLCPLSLLTFLHQCIQSHSCQLSDPELSNPTHTHLIFHFYRPKPHGHCFLSGFITLSFSLFLSYTKKWPWKKKQKQVNIQREEWIHLGEKIVKTIS